MHTMTAHERWALTGQWFACNTNEFNFVFCCFQNSIVCRAVLDFVHCLYIVPLLMIVLYMWVHVFLRKGIIPCP